MTQRILYFTVFTIMFSNVMPREIPKGTSFEQLQTSAVHFSKKSGQTGCTVTVGRKTSCLNRATNTASLNHDDDEDLRFFKQCIVEYYCFQMAPGVQAWNQFPDFEKLIGTAYFNATAKRVELFFIRNNDWSQTLMNTKFRDASTGECQNLLYVTAARYLYTIYVLNLLRDDGTFGPCERSNSLQLQVPPAGVCFPVPTDTLTCTSDFDIALLGSRSGSITARFNQFFREPLGTDNIVAGFGKSAEEIFDTNVHAFTLEYAMPAIFYGLTTKFKTTVETMNSNINFKIQEVVSAILKMNAYNNKFYNDLMSDQVELRSQPTQHNLDTVFHDWAAQFQGFQDAINSLQSSEQYSTAIGFQHKQNIAYEMILGLIDTSGITGPARTALAENAIALIYASEAYHTRGTIRHVVGLTQMQKSAELSSLTTIVDYWVSMLENWADAVKEHNRECTPHSLGNAACLPKMSKYLWRMLDAMHTIRTTLQSPLNDDLATMDTPTNTGIRSIMQHWLINVKRKGLENIPVDDPPLNSPTTNLHMFFQTFQCSLLPRYEQLSAGGCLDAIQAEIRKYNRRLFLHLVQNDPVTG